MPSQEYISELYPNFGVQAYHARGIYGSSVKMYIIDTGLSKKNLDNQNVIQRSFAGAPGSSQGHGSYVASIVAAPKNNFGIVGIAPQATVYLADVDNSRGIIYTSYIVSAINDAIKLDVDIISISLGTSEYDASLEDAVTRAAAKGILVFAAAGNSNLRLYEYPAACEFAISVASVNKDRGPSVFNTRNDAVALFAPGESVTVTSPNGSTTKVSGTSFACPFAASLAALVLSTMRATNGPTFRIRRQAMIDILRNKDHLALSCDVHNYTRANGCSGPGLSDATVPLLSNSIFNLKTLFGSSGSSGTSTWSIVVIIILAVLLAVSYGSK